MANDDLPPGPPDAAVRGPGANNVGLADARVEFARTSSGIDANVAAALAYGLGWITGVAFLLIERENRYVRYHAMQSTIVFAGLSVAFLLLQSIPLLGMLLAVFIVMPLSAVMWLILMFKAYKGERFKLPIAGEMAEQRL